MRQLALRGTLRRWLARIHRWSGLAIMVCLLIAAVTGTWLVFRTDLDRWLNPQLKVVEPSGARLTMDQIVTRVETGFPDALVSTVSFPERADASVAVSLRSKGEGRLPFDQVLVNPYTGAILGQRRFNEIAFARKNLDSLILGLHYGLLMDTPGMWIMGIAAAVWLVTSLIGLALSWPGRWLRMSSWLPILATRLNASTYKANYDLHRAGGVWLLPVLIVLAFTSVALNLPQYIRPVVNALSPLTRPPAGHPVEAKDASVSFDDAMATVGRMFPDARPNSIYRDLANGRHSVYFHLPGDANPQGDNFAFVDLQAGTLTALRLPGTSPAGDRFMAWLYPLHTGAAFGLPGRLLIAAAGVVTAGLNVTGLYVWWIKWRMRRRVARGLSAGSRRG